MRLTWMTLVTLAPLAACSATVVEGADPGDPKPPPSDPPPAVDPPPPDEPPPIDEPVPDPQDSDVQLELEGTHWTSKLEGSLGTYVTWFSFEADGEMEVTQELRQSWEDPVISEVQWVKPGSWSVLQNGDVRRDWTFSYTGTDPTELTATWTYAPLTGLLRDKLFEDWWQELSDEVWTRQALIARSGTTYRAHYEHTIDYPNGDGEYRMSAASVALNAAPALGGACTLELSLSYAQIYGTTNRTGDYEEVFDCSVRGDDESELWIVELDGFGDENGAVQSQWSEYLYAQGLPWEDVNAYTEAFSPRLYVDPADTRVLAFIGWSAQLLERELVSPPAP